MERSPFSIDACPMFDFRAARIVLNRERMVFFVSAFLTMRFGFMQLMNCVKQKSVYVCVVYTPIH